MTTQNYNSKTSSDERPRFPCFQVGISVLVRPISEDSSGALQSGSVKAQQVAFVNSLSVANLTLLSPQPFPDGTLVEIQMCPGTPTYQVRGIVLRTETQQLPGRIAYEADVRYVRDPVTVGVIPVIANYLMKRFPKQAVTQTTSDPAEQIVSCG